MVSWLERILFKWDAIQTDVLDTRIVARMKRIAIWECNAPTPQIPLRSIQATTDVQSK